MRAFPGILISRIGGGLAGPQDKAIEPLQDGIVGKLLGMLSQARKTRRRQAGKHLVNGQPRRIHVGACVHAAVGRHVASVPTRDICRSASVNKPKSASLQLASDKEAVCRLHVAVDHPGIVKRGQSRQQFAGPPPAFLRRQRPGLKAALQRGGPIARVGRSRRTRQIVGQIHDEEDMAGTLADMVNVHQVRMLTPEIRLQANDGRDFSPRRVNGPGLTAAMIFTARSRPVV